MPFSRIGHVAITVSDLVVSKEWYGRVLGWSALLDGDDAGVVFSVGALPGGVLIGLRQYADGSGDRFDHRRTGLDHLAIEVGSAEELPEWERRFAEQQVVYDPAQQTPFGHVLNFKDPDGIALELSASSTDSS